MDGNEADEAALVIFGAGIFGGQGVVPVSFGHRRKVQPAFAQRGFPFDMIPYKLHSINIHTKNSTVNKVCIENPAARISSFAVELAT